VTADERREVNYNYLSVTVSEPGIQPDLPGLLTGTKGVIGVHELTRTYGTLPSHEFLDIGIGSCSVLQSMASITNCTDGKAYVVREASGGTNPEAGDSIEVEDSGTRWTVPAVEQATGARPGLYLTPAAATGFNVTKSRTELQAQLDPAVPDVAEHVRNAIAPYAWRVFTYYVGQDDTDEIEQVFFAVRRALYAAALLTLLLAGASLLVVGLEQVRERRRPLAVMAASGVPRGTLARSLVWQNAIPLVISTVVAVATGILLGVLVTRVFGSEVAYDWAGIGTVAGISVGLVVVVTALTLPSLRRATGALGLRTE
jgi:ABC-type antimicrobial peptide transport system permease subunit